MLLDEQGNPIPETNPNPEQQSTGPTNSSELDLLRQLADSNARNAREESRRRQEAEEELARLRNQNNAPKPVQMTSEEFFADPIAALNAAVAAQVAPLRDFSAQVQRQNAYQALKQRFLQSAQYGQIVNSLGYNLDSIMASLEPTESNMINAIQTLVGQYALQNPQLFAPKAPEKDPAVVGDITPKDKPTPVTPPHLRPSAAPSPSNNINAPKKNYTENEKRLMREGGYSEEEWEVLLNSGSDLDAIRKFRKAKAEAKK